MNVSYSSVWGCFDDVALLTDCAVDRVWSIPRTLMPSHTHLTLPRSPSPSNLGIRTYDCEPHSHGSAVRTHGQSVRQVAEEKCILGAVQTRANVR